MKATKASSKKSPPIPRRASEPKPKSKKSASTEVRVSEPEPSGNAPADQTARTPRSPPRKQTIAAPLSASSPPLLFDSATAASPTDVAPSAQGGGDTEGGEKIATLGIQRDEALDYWIKKSGVGGAEIWAAPRIDGGAGRKTEGKRIASVKHFIDYDKYNYYLDADGDIARKARGWKRRAAQ
jgi:hypothetical protein